VGAPRPKRLQVASSDGAARTWMDAPFGAPLPLGLFVARINEVKIREQCLQLEWRSRISLTLIRATALNVAPITRYRDLETQCVCDRRV